MVTTYIDNCLSPFVSEESGESRWLLEDKWAGGQVG